jgi:hypothetical protein
VLKSLASPLLRTSTVTECRQRLSSLSAFSRVDLNWIPAHTGFYYNETVDQLAKAAAFKINCSPAPILPLSARRVRLEIRQWTAAKHQAAWAARTDCRQAREMLPVILPKRSREVLSLHRNKLRLVTALITGHCELQRHLHIMRLAPGPICPHCREQEETAFHFLAECPKWDRVRKAVFDSLTLTLPNLQSITPKKLLTFAEETGRFL